MTTRERKSIPVQTPGNTYGEIRIRRVFEDFKAQCAVYGWITDSWSLVIRAAHTNAQGIHQPRQITIEWECKGVRAKVFNALREPPNGLMNILGTTSYGYDYSVACGLMLRALIVISQTQAMQIARDADK